LDEQQHLALAWAGACLAEQRALMGRDYWPYNMADNLPVLETLLTFAHDQGLIPRPLAVDELFAWVTVDAPGA
jgi:4,5-dihydroxyphthalate decarboxylase